MLSRSNDDFIEKSVWVPDLTEVFVKGEIIEHINDDKIIVKIKRGNKNELIHCSKGNLQKCNSFTFENCDNVSDLCYLNEASVLNVLHKRYLNNLFYTYSGLFLISINPYKKIDIFDVKKFHERYKKESNTSIPHIYTIVESAYQNVKLKKKNQSILITGESGSGKTENTKNVIFYFSTIGSNTEMKDENNIGLKVSSANPILESFGNSKTVKNNNSSRFGKFIKVFFDEHGVMVGSNIEYYLLEKIRIIHQSTNERSYHIFYQFLKGFKNLHLFKLSSNINNYKYLNNNENSSDIDDDDGFILLMNSFKIMNFSQNDIYNIFSIIAVILHLGNIEFDSLKTEQTRISNYCILEIISDLLGIKLLSFNECLITPKVKAGKEYIKRNRKPNEVQHLIDAFAKFLYEKLFQFTINKINDYLKNDSINDLKNLNFIGILDIAGFEVFELNSFEQFCINYTNEKLQQFFNYQSILKKKKEYLDENIVFDDTDINVDLKSNIEIIESKKPPGIFKILDEFSFLFHTKEGSFLDDLNNNFVGKKDNRFSINKLKNSFVINHYAGDVEYDVTDWIRKNMDPIDENIVKLVSNSSFEFIRSLINIDENLNYLDRSSIKFKSASQKHQDQLNNFLNQLMETKAHFIRCILPNQDKKPNLFNKKLVLSQLKCNGVIEGIKMLKKGYHCNFKFFDFVKNFSIVVQDIELNNDLKNNCHMILNSFNFDASSYQIGTTKIFLQKDVLFFLKKKKEIVLSKIFTYFQCFIRSYLLKLKIKSNYGEIKASNIIAKTFKDISIKLISNYWFNLFVEIKLILSTSKDSLESLDFLKNFNELEQDVKQFIKSEMNFDIENQKLNNHKNSLEKEVILTKKVVNDSDGCLKKIKNDEAKVTLRLNILEKEFNELKQNNQKLKKEKLKLETQLFNLSSELRYEDNTLKKTKNLNLLNLNDPVNTTRCLKKNTIQNNNLMNHVQLENCFTNFSDNNNFLINNEQLKESKSNLKKVDMKEEHKLSELNNNFKVSPNKSTDFNDFLSLKKEKLYMLKNEINNKTVELENIEKELLKLNHNNKQVKEYFNKLLKLKKDLKEKKDIDTKYLEEIESFKLTLKNAYNENKITFNKFEKLKVEYENFINLKSEYSFKISLLSKKIMEFETMLINNDLNKENINITNESYPDLVKLKFKLNEQSEKFHNNDFFFLHSNINQKEQCKKESEITKLKNDIENYKILLRNEKSNSQKAENYAVQLQKELNKQKNLNFENDITNTSLATLNTKSQNNILKIGEKNISIYEELKTQLEATRSELLCCENEILNLKSCLKKSEDEFYKYKTESLNFSNSTHNEEIKKLREKNELFLNENDQLKQLIKEYNLKFEKYEKRLSFIDVESVRFKKRESELVDELNDKKNQLLLSKEELRSFEILIKKIRKEHSICNEIDKEKTQKLLFFQSQVDELKLKLKNNEPSDKCVSEDYIKDIEILNNELNFKNNNQILLSKQNKEIQVHYESLLNNNKLLTQKLCSSSEKNILLEKELETMYDKSLKTQNENDFYEKKLLNLNNQIDSMKKVIEDISDQRDNLLLTKKSLEEQVLILKNDFYNVKIKLEQSESYVKMLKDHIKNQKKYFNDVKNELNSYKKSYDCDFFDLKNLRKNHLVTIEENKSLKIVNDDLTDKIKNLNKKLYSENQQKTWEKKLNILTEQLDNANLEKLDYLKTINILNDKINHINTCLENETQFSKKVNDENFRYQNKIIKLKSTIQLLEKNKTNE